MKLDDKSPASTQLKDLISIGIQLDQICEAAYFTLRYIEKQEDPTGHLFITDSQYLKTFLNKLEEMRDLLPAGICNLISRKSDYTMNLMLGSSEDSIYRRITVSGTTDPETIIGYSKTNIEKLNKLREQLKEDLQKLHQAGIEDVAEKLGQMIFTKNLDNLNNVTKTKLSGYRPDILQLKSLMESKSAIQTISDSEMIGSENEERKRPTLFSEGKNENEKLRMQKTISDLIESTLSSLNVALHPAIVFEMLKKCITTFEYYNELGYNPPGNQKITQMLTFMKNQSTPERFKAHLADINACLNAEPAEKNKSDGQQSNNIPDYKIENKYMEIGKVFYKTEEKYVDDPKKHTKLTKRF